MSLPTGPLGCSAFCLRDGDDLWIARNLDVPFTEGFILSNPRGLRKKSVVQGDVSPARWISRWGSLTVNLLGLDFPMGGINECGLVVEHLWMPGTAYPDRRTCDTLLEFEWIQFMLDTCASVDDVCAQTEYVAIPPDRVEMHFLLGDGKGNGTLLEFRDGRPLFYAGDAFQPSVVTNSWHDESVQYLRAFAGFGGESAPSPDSTESLDRFARLACTIRNGGLREDLPIPQAAMRLLDTVADSTLLSAVFHPSAGSMAFKTSRNPDPRLLRIADFDFSPVSPRMQLDIHATADALSPFNPQRMVSCMQAVLAVGGEFLNLDAYRHSMMARQLEGAVAM